jgi:hypothetical protein
MVQLGRLLAVFLLIVTIESTAGPFWGAKQSSPVDTPLDALKRGPLTKAMEPVKIAFD